MRDHFNDLNFKQLFPPKAAVTDNTVQTSSIIDMLGYNSCTLALTTGTLSGAGASFTVTLEHGDAANLSDASAPAAKDIVGTTALASFDSTSSNVCRKIGYVGDKRYIRMKVTPTSNSGNLFLSGVAVLGNPKLAPQANPPV